MTNPERELLLLVAQALVSLLGFVRTGNPAALQRAIAAVERQEKELKNA